MVRSLFVLVLSLCVRVSVAASAPCSIQHAAATELYVWLLCDQKIS
jgi:hypothetical protein